MIQAPPRRELLISTQVVAGGRGRALEEGAVAGLALDGGVDSLVGLHVVVAPGSTPLSEDHSLVTASLPMPRGDRVLVTGVDGRRVRKSALGLDEDGRDTILAELTNGADGRTCSVPCGNQFSGAPRHRRDVVASPSSRRRPPGSP